MRPERRRVTKTFGWEGPGPFERKLTWLFLAKRLIEALKEMSLFEASELVKDIEETFGVSAAAPVAVAAAPAAGAAAAEERPSSTSS